MQSHPSIIALILNTNRKADTLACIQSIRDNLYPSIQIVVLDNSSTDGSVEAIFAQFPSVTILPLRENKGYAGNNNAGLEYALAQNPDWIFVLNEDVILAQDALQQMMDAVSAHPQAGVIGPLVCHFDEPHIIQSAGGSFTQQGDSLHLAQNEPDSGQFKHPYNVDWISGCALGVRAQAIRQAGLIDERFFYYWEETDWCFRIRKSGWEVLLIPSAKVWHKGVQRNYLPTPNVTYYATRNRLLFYKNHRMPLRTWISTYLYFMRTLLAWSLKPKWRPMLQNRDALMQGMRDYFRQQWGQRQI